MTAVEIVASDELWKTYDEDWHLSWQWLEKMWRFLENLQIGE